MNKPITLERSYSPAGIAYHHSGDKQGGRPPVLLIHGVGLRAESWLPQIDALTASHSVFAIDLPGLGESPRFNDPASVLSDYTAAVGNFIETAIHQPAIVIGHSLGALISIDLAVNHPSSCRAIAPLNGIFDRTPDALAAVQARARALQETVDADWDMALVTAPVARWFGDNPTGRDFEMAALCTAWLEANDHAGYAAAYSAFANTTGPAAADLAAIRMPDLFLTGKLDPNSTPAMTEEMASHVAGAEAIVVPKAAHMTGLTHPDEVNTALLSFLDRISKE